VSSRTPLLVGGVVGACTMSVIGFKDAITGLFIAHSVNDVQMTRFNLILGMNMDGPMFMLRTDM
jgi:hypothetical protein